MAFDFCGGALATKHRAANAPNPTPICQLTDNHLLNIIRRHCKNVRAALEIPVASIDLRGCWIVCNFQALIAPYIQEALVRGLWKDCQYELENVYKRSCQVPGAKALKNTRFSPVWLAAYQQQLELLEQWRDAEDDWGLDWRDFQC